MPSTTSETPHGVVFNSLVLSKTQRFTDTFDTNKNKTKNRKSSRLRNQCRFDILAWNNLSIIHRYTHLTDAVITRIANILLIMNERGKRLHRTSMPTCCRCWPPAPPWPPSLPPSRSSVCKRRNSRLSVHSPGTFTMELKEREEKRR